MDRLTERDEYKKVFKAIEPFTLEKDKEPTPIIYSLLCKAKMLGCDKWVYGYYIYYKNNPLVDCKEHHYIIDCNGCKETAIDPETLCKCTGLTDKNGNLIFEGDILGFDGVSGSYDLVEYHNGVFGVRLIPEDGGENYSCCEFPLWEELSTCVPTEVIGNIHDNLELLKGENNEM